MELINVIVVGEYEGVNSIVTFTAGDMLEAEKEFVEKAKSLIDVDWSTEEGANILDEIEGSLDDGYYETSDKLSTVYLVWSEVKNLVNN